MRAPVKKPSASTETTKTWVLGVMLLIQSPTVVGKTSGMTKNQMKN